MDKQTACKILGIRTTADFEAISKAYRRKCLKYHPDKNHSLDAPEKFLKVKTAYEFLLVDDQTNPFSSQTTYHHEVQVSIREIYMKIPVTVTYGECKTVSFIPRPGETKVIKEVGDDILIINIQVIPNSKFYYKNDILVKKVYISLEQALAGGELQIEHITGKVFSLTLPDGTYACPDTMVAVPGQDLVVEFIINYDTDAIPINIQKLIRENWAVRKIIF